MASQKYIKEPAYFGKFRCIGDKCPNDCCHMWDIIWKRNEVERLKNAECSESLRNIIDGSFTVRDEGDKHYIIKCNENTGNCPFLENGLCRIQKELGEEYLSDTCRTYPRYTVTINGISERNCNTSCYVVLDFLCSDENSMEILTKPFKEENINGIFYSKEQIAKKPELKFLFEIRTFLMNILSERSHSFETSIVLGAVAAKIIDNNVNAGKIESIPELLRTLAPQMKDKAQIEKLEAVKPNYSIKLGFGKAFLDLISDQKLDTIIENEKEVVHKTIFSHISYLIDNNSIDPEKYIIGENKFRKTFAKRSYVLRNIALNIFMECSMPFKDTNYSIYDNYCAFVAQVAAVKLLAAAAGYKDENAEKTEHIFKMKTAAASRRMCHTMEYIGAVTNLMKQYGCTSPAHLAYVLK